MNISNIAKHGDVRVQNRIEPTPREVCGKTVVGLIAVKQTYVVNEVKNGFVNIKVGKWEDTEVLEG